MRWPSSFTNLVGSRYPIVCAPMMGVDNVAVAAAVSNAGGLGSFAGTNLAPEVILSRAAEARAAIPAPLPFHLNFFAHEEPGVDARVGDSLAQALQGMWTASGLGELPAPYKPYPSFTPEMLDAVLEARVPVVSFHFGLPRFFGAVEALQAAGVVVMASATSVEEATHLEDRGVDAIIAQSGDAGGHHGWFLPTTKEALDTFTLVRAVAASVKVPVVAAGGIMNGSQIAAAFALGASGVQLGTAFLVCKEMGTPAAHRAQLQAARRGGAASETLSTCGVSGRHARGLATPFLRSLLSMEDEAAPFPNMNPLTRPLSATGNPENGVYWCGRGVRRVREDGLCAKDLVATLVAETEAALCDQRH